MGSRSPRRGYLNGVCQFVGARHSPILGIWIQFERTGSVALEAHHRVINQSKPDMTAALGTWRYLLRNGRFISVVVRLGPEHVFPHVTKDGTVIFALLSESAEQLLLQSIRQLQPFSGSSDTSLLHH